MRLINPFCSLFLPESQQWRSPEDPNNAMSDFHASRKNSNAHQVTTERQKQITLQAGEAVCFNVYA